MTTPSNPRLDAALAYALEGFHLVPVCVSGSTGGCMHSYLPWHQSEHHVGKVPLTNHGYNSATDDPAIIKSFWKQFPEANIGIALGQSHNLVAVEFDMHRNSDGFVEHDGLDTLMRLEDEHGKFPRTRTHLSGGTGQTFLFSWPEGYDIRSHHVPGCPGMEVKADNGIVAPPSKHVEGFHYEMLDDALPAPLPLWLLNLIATPARAKVVSYPFTDLGNAERLVNRHGQSLRYCYGMKNFLIWNGTHWQEDKCGQAERFAKDTVRTMYLEAAATPDDKRKELVKHALASESKKRIHDMLMLAQSEPDIPIKREELDASPWLLNCSNGTLDLRTGKPYPHRRGDLLTRCLPIRYDPEAEAPLWIEFLTTIFHGDADLIEYIQRVVGYALTGDTSEQCFFLGYGKGDNGKSTFLETLYTILGEYAQSAEFKAFLARDNEGVRNDIARMAGRRLVIAKEADRGKRFAESLIKSLTGGDTVTARFLYQDFFDFKPTHKVFLAVNHKPTIKGTDQGIWRRVRLIPFNVTISEAQKDRDLPHKLAAEAEGILAWAVAGCLAWQREGLGTPPAVKDATGAYRQEMDIVAQFLSQECIFAKGEKVGASALKTRYEAWCDANSERYDAKGLRAALLEKECINKRGTGGPYVWQGVMLKSEEKVNSEPE